jgi:hypothetical protein
MRRRSTNHTALITRSDLVNSHSTYLRSPVEEELINEWKIQLQVVKWLDISCIQSKVYTGNITTEN